MDRKKLDLSVNTPTEITMLFDDPIIGEGKYGPYWLYAICRDSENEQYSFFAPNIDVHNKLKELKSGDKAVITKLASQQGKKLITVYDVQPVEKVETGTTKTQPTSEDDFLFTAMEKSLEQSIRLAKKFNSVPIDKLAISLFIARTKSNFSFSN